MLKYHIIKSIDIGIAYHTLGKWIKRVIRDEERNLRFHLYRSNH